MAISFPRQMPDTPFTETTFTLDHGTAVARHAKGGAGTVSQIREPLWRGKFVVSPPSAAGRNQWQAWANTLRGGLKYFLGWDVSRPEPRAYPNGVPAIIATTWDGEGTVSSISTAGQIDASGAPAGFQLLVGDRVGLVEDGIYGYFDVVEDAAADGSGDISITVEPLVQSMFSTSAVVVFRRPKVKMQIISGSFESRSTYDPTPVSFEAVQVLV